MSVQTFDECKVNIADPYHTEEVFELNIGNPAVDVVPFGVVTEGANADPEATYPVV